MISVQNPVISVYWFLSLLQAVGFGHRRPYCQMFHVSSSFSRLKLSLWTIPFEHVEQSYDFTLIYQPCQIAAAI
jgi:hypothetical protein